MGLTVFLWLCMVRIAPVRDGGTPFIKTGRSGTEAPEDAEDGVAEDPEEEPVEEVATEPVEETGGTERTELHPPPHPHPPPPHPPETVAESVVTVNADVTPPTVTVAVETVA